jgi:hypothetical protein
MTEWLLNYEVKKNGWKQQYFETLFRHLIREIEENQYKL